MRISSLVAFLLLLCMCAVVSSSSSSQNSLAVNGPSSSLTTSSLSTTAVQDTGGNVVFQFAGYIKDSIVRTVDGCREMARNHRICNGIRDKQREHREKLRLQWEATGSLTKEEIKRRLQTVNGGISYDEYMFLAKGKEDRSKLVTVLLMMWGAPRFLPYALMMYPEMLPSPFESPRDGGSESRLQRISRERSHAVLKTLIQLERDAKIVPTMAKLNIFGRNKQQSEMVRIEKINNATVNVLLKTPELRGLEGAGIILQTLEKLVFRAKDHSRGERCLVTIPRAIVQGLQHAIDGGPSVLTSILPNFVTRGRVLSHIRKVTESDEFLVHENIHLDTLGRTRLIEACDDRLMGGCGLGRSDDELRESLKSWLDVTVIQPEQRCQQSGEFYNGNLARAILMCYHAVDSLRDSRSTSFLPRLLLQAPPPPQPSLTVEQQLSNGEEKQGGSGNSKKGLFFQR